MTFLRTELSRWPIGSSLSSSFSWIENKSKNLDFLNLLAFTASFWFNSRAFLYSCYSSAWLLVLVVELRDVWELVREEQFVLPAKELRTDFNCFSPITALVLKIDWPRGDDLVDWLFVWWGGIYPLMAFFCCLWTFGLMRVDLDIISVVFFWRVSIGGSWRGWLLSDCLRFKFWDTVLFLLRSRSCWGSTNFVLDVGDNKIWSCNCFCYCYWTANGLFLFSVLTEEDIGVSDDGIWIMLYRVIFEECF